MMAQEMSDISKVCGEALIFSSGIRKIRYLSTFLPEFSKFCGFPLACQTDLQAVIGWGHKPTADRARRYAAKNNLPYIALEDGFLRSIRLGKDGENPLSLVVDPVGIYYDARQPSQLELWLEEGQWTQPELLERARDVRRSLVEERLSKYNQAPEKSLWPDRDPERVLVVDQTFGDMSVAGALADEASFSRMLQAALDENPHADILIKTHPDVLAGYRKGYLVAIPDDPRIQLLSEDVHPWSVLDSVDKVYTVSSLLGFEALLAGKAVHCFGMPFYAGWGLTRDDCNCARRTRTCCLDELVAAAYLKYARYVDPIAGKSCKAEQTIRLLADRRRHFLLTSGVNICSRASIWRRGFLDDFITTDAHRLTYVRNPERAIDRAVKKNGRWVLWASRETDHLRRCAQAQDIPMLRLEDAFLRSVGLGSDLVKPGSLVLDDEGIYYDCSRPSRLERLLTETDFSECVLARARHLRKAILQSGLTKYNVGVRDRVALQRDDRSVVLVPGQVEDDASIVRGSPEIKSNLELLRRARAARPDAYIIYKPHPDVLVGNRRGRVDEKEAQRLSDRIVTDLAMDRLLEEVDEVHTMTSLTGFEALLRAKQVTCYGLPFYAGWGLTEDRLKCERRGRSLTLDQLVAATLILYPTYVDPNTRQICTAEHFLDWLESNRKTAQGPRWKTRLIRLLQNWRQGVRP